MPAMIRTGLLVLCIAQVAVAQAPVRTPHIRALRRECDALLDQVVKRPYGWGWRTDSASADANSPAAREPVVSLEPLHTPSAALLLLYASDVLEDRRYAEAAQNVGRLLAASVQPSGQIPSRVAIGPRLLNRERPRPLPDRASTRASIALLLSLIKGKEADLNQDELLTRAAGRGAAWMVKQQPLTGAWPVAYPPDAEAAKVSRLVRLDTPDTRDNVLAMLLAYEVLGEASQRRSVERSIAFLMRVRNPEGQRSGAGMVGPAFDSGGNAIEKIEAFRSDTTDVLASRCAIQTFFAGYIVLGPKEWGRAASLAAGSASQLPVPELGKWHRWYTPKGDPVRPEALTVAPAGFKKSDDPLVGDWGLARSMQVVNTHDQIGREKFLQRLKASFTIRERLALTVCGLMDEPMDANLPTSIEQAKQYLQQNETTFQQATGTTDTDLPAKVRRLWALYLRARLEKEFGV
jgi:hypothetical protein